MWKYPIYLMALSITNILVAEEAMARWEAKTCTDGSILRNYKDQPITFPGDPPIKLTKGAIVSVLNNCEHNLCRLGRPFRSDPSDQSFLDVYVRKVYRNQTLITGADQPCDETEYGYGASDQPQY